MTRKGKLAVQIDAVATSSSTSVTKDSTEIPSSRPFYADNRG